MGIDYNAMVFYGYVKKSTDFTEAELEEWGFTECLEEFTSSLNVNELSYLVLGYDSDEEGAIIGKCLSNTSYDYYKEIDNISEEEKKYIDEALGIKCKMLCALSIM
jgi:hypothetical protein